MPRLPSLPAQRPASSRLVPRLLVCGLLACAVALPALAGADLEPGRHDRSLFWDGIERTWFIHVPPGYDPALPTPLLVAIHGFGSNAGAHQSLSGMSEVADENGFLIAYPNGVDNRWNAGICCAAPDAAQDDVGFLRAMVAAVELELHVDPERIYVTGLSNGGAMTHRLACEAADLFAAAAPVAFALPFRPIEDCQPSRPIPVLNFMGLNDVLVPYDGNAFFNGAQESFGQWRANNACGPEPAEIVEVTGGSDCVIDTSCAEGVETGLCSVDSRSLPGTPVEGHILYMNDDIDVARTAWDFLSRFPVPEPGAAPLQSLALAVVVWMRAASRRRR